MVYLLFDICLLMVVNIYVVNFSLGVDVYSKQLFFIGDQIVYYSGLVIMVGDFNVWSCRRMNVLYCFVWEMLLCQVCFIDDQCCWVFGCLFDFVFYCGLNVSEVFVLVMCVFDYNLLFVEFSFGKFDK